MSSISGYSVNFVAVRHEVSIALDKTTPSIMRARPNKLLLTMVNGTCKSDQLHGFEVDGRWIYGSLLHFYGPSRNMTDWAHEEARPVASVGPGNPPTAAYNEQVSSLHLVR